VLDAARATLRTAVRREAGVLATREAEELRSALGELRSRLELTAERGERLRPTLEAATAERDELLRLSATRQSQIAALRFRRTALAGEQAARADRESALTDELTRLDLAELAARWDGTPETAQRHLLDLTGERARFGDEDWWQEAKRLLASACARCFPPGEEAAGLPVEVAQSLVEFEQRGPGSARRAQAAFPRLASALRVYLRQQEGYDRHSREQIAAQRTERHGSLMAARQGHAEAVEASRAFRGTLTEAVTTKLAAVHAEFDRLDRAYGGYGAGLLFEEPEPPADPAEPWAWKVTPVWRRAEGRRPVPYNRRANTAQMDDRAIKLVCAAALASGTGRPLVLILDELGRNLGKQHRREAVALLGQIGRDSGITVVGALQDDMEPYAIDACGQYIKLRRRSDSSPYNEQPVVVGYDEQAARVALLREWLAGSGYHDQGP
ncbi:MAG: hypothetical protein HKP61_06010, partial [Dactylosporangium sp.]|nr:hypothetical protein [Dactylosporangium sp.]NNJ60501.1 hypothetical protein [Dactylosporangium sp.]